MNESQLKAFEVACAANDLSSAKSCCDTILSSCSADCCQPPKVAAIPSSECDAIIGRLKARASAPPKVTTPPKVTATIGGIEPDTIAQLVKLVITVWTWWKHRNDPQPA